MISSYPVGVGLGSNMGDRLQHLQEALLWLETLSDRPACASPVYETSPLDCPDETSPFLNAVCEIHFRGDLLELLHQMRAFEMERGRLRIYKKNTPRPLDLDMLYAGKLVMQTKELTLPHPRMLKRRFVLQPLCDIRPDLILPTLKQPVKVFLASVSSNEKIRLYDEL